MNRRDLITTRLPISETLLLSGVGVFGAVEHKYRLASESIIPEGMQYATNEIRESYRLVGLIGIFPERFAT